MKDIEMQNDKNKENAQPDETQVVSQGGADGGQTVKMKYGKFADAEQLLAAYENLEREFTKKSQRLKALEKSAYRDNEEGSPRIYPTDNFDFQNPTEGTDAVDNPAKEANGFGTRQILQDEESLEKYILDNPAVGQRVLQIYAERLSQSDLPRTINSRGGAMSLTPPKKPKTIKEASKMAEKFFNK